LEDAKNVAEIDQSQGVEDSYNLKSKTNGKKIEHKRERVIAQEHKHRIAMIKVLFF
jgi:hypothetical protein